MKMSTDRNWLLKRADQEDRHIVSVGSLDESEQELGAPAEVTRTAFIRLLEFARRERQLTLEELATKTDVDVAELVMIENNPSYQPVPRTVHNLARFLKVPANRLMVLAGLVELKDAEFEEAALRFAAKSQSTDVLSDNEHRALREYVKFLCEK